jgi:flagellin
MLSISGNIGSTQARKSVLDNAKETQATLAKLSSGKRVNSAQDDAAALAIAVGLTAQQTSLDQAVRNAGDAGDVVNTADAALSNTTDILSRLRELSIASGSGALNPIQRGDIQNEIDSLQTELDRVANSTEFNGTPLLSGRVSLTYQVGSGNVAANDRLTVDTTDATAAGLGLGQIGLPPPANPASSLDSIDAALQAVSSARATFGTQATRASSAAQLAAQQSINLTRARSSLTDADVATETSNLSRDVILGDAAASVLVQANQNPQAALRLLSPS